MKFLRKFWRNTSRRLFGYVVLFFLGVFTCLFCLQILQLNALTFSSDLNESSFYYSHSGDTNLPPCDPSRRNSDLKSQGRILDFQDSNPGASYYEEVLGENVQRPDDIRKPKNLVQDGLFAHRTSLNSYRRLVERNELGNQERFLKDGITVPGVMRSGEAGGPTVWIVTPTFYRPEQQPELTRLAQALTPVSHFIHWIIIDDISQGSEQSLKELQRFLVRFPLTITLLKSVPPENMKIVGKPRGVGGRRSAIAWLRQHKKEGVVYFADDDNTYDSQIFRQMQGTRKVSMWPVGLVTSFGVSSPIVKGGQVVGFYDGWNGLRKFPVDMAGFAINMNMFIAKPKANMPWVAGYEEDQLLRSLGVSIRDIRPLANNCTQILVWHTKTTRNAWPTRPKILKPEIESNTNLKRLLQTLPQKALAGPSSSTKDQQNNETFSILKFFFGRSGT